ncbi:hypothetical protein IL306_013843, partial [Fusarium sp. DS 682]
MKLFFALSLALAAPAFGAPNVIAGENALEARQAGKRPPPDQPVSVLPSDFQVLAGRDDADEPCSSILFSKD